MPAAWSTSGRPMPDNSRSCGELIEPALTTTSRLARASYCCPFKTVAHADAALSVEQQAFGQRIGLDLQVRAPARRVEIAHRGAHPTTAADRRLRHADAVLLRAVVVLRVGDADLAGRLDQRVVNRAALVVFADPQRPVAAAVFAVAVALVAFHLLEDRQHLAVAPAAIAELRPGVVVLRLAAHEHHAVDRRRAAQQLAARDRDAALTGAVVGLRGVQPVCGRVLDQFGEADRDPRPGMAFPARFQHQHPVLRIGAEPVGEDRAGRAGAHHDVIKDLGFHVEPVVLRSCLGRCSRTAAVSRCHTPIPNNPRQGERGRGQTKFGRERTGMSVQRQPASVGQASSSWRVAQSRSLT